MAGSSGGVVRFPLRSISISSAFCPKWLSPKLSSCGGDPSIARRILRQRKSSSGCTCSVLMQHCLYFFPLPQGQGVVTIWLHIFISRVAYFSAAWCFGSVLSFVHRWLKVYSLNRVSEKSGHDTSQALYDNAADDLATRSRLHHVGLQFVPLVQQPAAFLAFVQSL